MAATELFLKGGGVVPSVYHVVFYRRDVLVRRKVYFVKNKKKGGLAVMADAVGIADPDPPPPPFSFVRFIV